MDHSVVFSGQIREGVAHEQVRNNFARLFRLDDEHKLNQLFSGKPVVLKKGLSADEARKYEQALLKAGAICEVRQTGAAPVPVPALGVTAVKPKIDFGPLADDVPETPVAAPAQPAAPDFASMMAGIVIPSVEEKPAAPPAPPAPAPAAPAAPAAAPAQPAAPAPRFSMLDNLTLAPIEPRPGHEDEAAPAAAVAPLAVLPSGAVPPPPPPSVALGQPVESPRQRNRPVLDEENEPWNPHEMPDVAKGLCWAGFFMPYVWAAGNGLPYTLAILVAYRVMHFFVPYSVMIAIHFGICLFLLFKGRELAWRHKSWINAKYFNSTQRYWNIGCGIFFALLLLIFGLIASSAYSQAKKTVQQQTETQELQKEMEREQQEAQAQAREQRLLQHGEPVVDPVRAREELLQRIPDLQERERVRQRLEELDARRKAAGSGSSFSPDPDPAE